MILDRLKNMNPLARFAVLAVGTLLILIVAYIILVFIRVWYFSKRVAPPPVVAVSSPRHLALRRSWEVPFKSAVAVEARKSEVWVMDVHGTLLKVDRQGQAAGNLSFPAQFATFCFVHRQPDWGLLVYSLNADATNEEARSSAVTSYSLDGTFEWQYPLGPKEMLATLQTADLSGDGTDEIFLGFDGTNRLDCLNTAGKELWKFEGLDYRAFSLAVLPPPPGGKGGELLVAPGRCNEKEQRCLTLALDADGQEKRNFDPKLFIQNLYVERLEDASDEIIAIGAPAVLGCTAEAHWLNRQGESQRSFTLAGGMFYHWSAPQIVVAPLTGDGKNEWVIIGTDGVIHVLSAQGQELDQWSVGQRPHGLRFLPAEGNSPAVLVVLDEDGLVGYTVGQ